MANHGESDALPGDAAAGSLGLRLARLRLLAVLLLAAVTCPALGAHAVDIATVLGFSDTFRPGHWTPLTVTVTNRGEALRGELEVEVATEEAARGRVLATHHRRGLELARNSRKSVQFTVLPQGLFHPLVVRVRSGVEEVARTEIDLRQRFAPQRLLLVLARNADLDYLNDSAVEGLRVLYPHPELLPGHWRGYDAVAAIVLQGVSLERLSTSQFEALHKWIAQGGILAVCGGPDYTLLKSTRFAALLPGTPAGSTRLEPAAIARAFAFEPPQSAHVDRLERFRGSVRLSADAVPLIVERAVGRGRVLYFTFDVTAAPFDRWDGMRALWLEHLRLPPATGLARGPESAGASAVAALIRAQAPAFPRYSVALLFAVFYLGLLFACHTLPQEGQRRRWLGAWCAWGVPVLLAPVAWLLFGPSAFPRGASAATAALIEPLPGSPYARITLELGVHANRNGPLHFEYTGAEPVLQFHRHAQRTGRAEDWVIGEGPRRFVQPSGERRYVLHALEGEDVIAFALQARLRNSAAGLELTLDNRAGRLDDLWLVFDGRAYELGTLGPGARLERRLGGKAAGIEVGATSWRRVLRPLDPQQPHLTGPGQILLERKARSAPNGVYPRPGHALLIGYTDSPLRPAGASSQWSHQASALVALELAAHPDEQDASGREPGSERSGRNEEEAAPAAWIGMREPAAAAPE